MHFLLDKHIAMSMYGGDFIVNTASSYYSTETVEKLFFATEKEHLLSYSSLYDIMPWSGWSGHSEQYVDDLLASIEQGTNQSTATKAFTVSCWQKELPYYDTLQLISTGAYQTTNGPVLTLDQRVAKELTELGFIVESHPIDNDYNRTRIIDDNDLNNAYSNGNAVRLRMDNFDGIDQRDPYPRIAIMVSSLSLTQDEEVWEQFKKWFSNLPNHNDIVRSASGEEFKDLFYKYKEEQYPRDEVLKKLSEKIGNEYSAFVDELKSCSAADVYMRAYEITSKDYITYMFSRESSVDLSAEQLDALLSCDNSLNEIFSEWLKYDSTDFQDVVDCAGKVADDITTSRNSHFLSESQARS